MRVGDTLTAIYAAETALANWEDFDKAGRAALSRQLRGGSADRSDPYRASRMLGLLAIFAAVEPSALHPAITIAQDRREVSAEPWEAESVVTVLGALDALHPDELLRREISEWAGYEDALVQAEAQVQLGRAFVRRAAKAQLQERRTHLEEAHAAFTNALAVEERTDAALWQQVVKLLLLVQGGVPAPSDLEGAIALVRGLGRERLMLSFESQGFWRVREDQLLLYAGEELALLARDFSEIESAPSLLGPLALLGEAARQAPLVAEPTGVALTRLWQHGIVQAAALTLDLRVQNARRKLESLLTALPLEASDRPVLADLASRLEAYERARAFGESPPKVEGVAEGGAAPQPLADIVLALEIADRLGQRGGYPVASEIIARLHQKVRTLTGPISPEAIALVTIGLELLVGFVVQRTIDPTLRQTGREEYLYAAPRGLGKKAVEEHVRKDYLRYILASDYAWLADREQTQLDGRADVILVHSGLPLTTETKRETTNASQSAIDAKYVPQAQSYVPHGPRIGFLLVLDLTERIVDPDVRDRFWVARHPSAVGTGEHPDYVVVAVLSGNRTSPSARRPSAKLPT